MLSRHREELLRRALTLAVTRSSLDALVERSLAERLDDLELLFEAASGSGDSAEDATSRQPLDLQAELNRQLDEHRAHGRAFSVAVVAAGPARIGRLEQNAPISPRSGPSAADWGQALRDSATPSDIVIDAGDGATAVILPGHGRREAAIAVDRLCRFAWRALGEVGPQAGAGIATYPDDGASGYEILAAAYDGLWRQADFGPQAPAGSGEHELPPRQEGPPAPVHPLRPV